MTLYLSGMLVAPLDGPSLPGLECGSVRRIVAEVARILHFDSFTTRRGVFIDPCTAVVVTSFIKRRCVDVELLVIEFYGCLQTLVYSPAWISRAIPFASRPISTSSFL
jgi:hypothetical protein